MAQTLIFTQNRGHGIGKVQMTRGSDTQEMVTRSVRMGQITAIFKKGISAR